MKITPIEIRQKHFEKNFRGYDADEVQAFLNSLSQAWESMQTEARELKLRLENSEQEVAKLREVENSLFKALKTAEDTSRVMVEQAREKAEITVREADMQAEALLKDARWKAKSIIEEAEDEAKQTFQNLQKEVRNLERNHQEIEGRRDNLLAEMRHLAQDLLERIERERGRTQRTLEVSSAEPTPRLVEPASAPKEAPSAPPEEEQDGSFFDQL